MAIVPSLNSLKHVALMLKAASADSEFQAFVAQNHQNRPELARVAALQSDDYRQVATFLDDVIKEREAKPE